MASSSPETKAKEKQNDSSPASPNVRKALFGATLLGVGAILGYATFKTIFSHRCADLLDDAEGRHNVTLQSWEENYARVMEDHQNCITDETKELELSELRGRAQSHIEIAAKYQALLEKYENNMEALAAVRVDRDRLSKEVESLTAGDSDSHDLRDQADLLSFQRDELKRRMQREKEDSLKKLQGLQNEIQLERKRYEQDIAFRESFLLQRQSFILQTK